MNTIGRLFRLTTFGESHGPYIGGVIDGCPAGLTVDKEYIESQLKRRRSRGGPSTARKEKDKVKFVSGLINGVTTGAPIAYLFANEDVKSADYDTLADVYRPSHADYTYECRYGVRDHRGGGRSSARETAVRVVAGAIAQQILHSHGIEICSYTSQVGGVAMPLSYFDEVTREIIQDSRVGCPIAPIDEVMHRTLEQVRAEGDTLGGIVSTIVRGVPAGWGSPLYDKISARLSAAIMSINACKGIEIGDGFLFSAMRGSEANDQLHLEGGRVHTLSNHSGGIQGGLTNGEVIRFRSAFKPISSHAQSQRTVSRHGEEVELRIEGRHDASVFPRVLPVVDAMTAMVLVDELLFTPTYRLPL